MVFEGDKLKPWGSIQAHSYQSRSSQGKYFFPSYFSVHPIHLKQSSAKFIYTLAKAYHFITFAQPNYFQLKFSEFSLACQMWQEYLFIHLFIHPFICMYVLRRVLVQSTYYSSKYKVADAQLLR